MENKSVKKRYNFQTQEPFWQNFWAKKGINNFDPASKKPLYTIDTPPPTVSGAIHLGHIFSYSQAEIIARFKHLDGFNVRYPFGFDNNGLPTERLVEKEKHIRGHDLPRDEFIKQCLEVTEDYKQKYQSLWQRVALSVDWRLVYSTISPGIQKLSQSVFKELFEKDIIYEQDSPVLFCPECGTSIAQAEVEDKAFDAKFYDIIFKLEGSQGLLISTTRPELLPACVAVFANPDDKRYKKYFHQQIITPLGVKVPILSDDRVEADKGTGLVMCCTYGDETDVYWVKKYHLPEIVIVDSSGMITNCDHFPEINGKDIIEARDFIVNYLKTKNYLKTVKETHHNVGVHERCGTPVELIPTPQWFVKILDIKDELIASGEKIKWYPAFMKKRYREWINGLKWDWCISRQRFYGIPIPVFYCSKCTKNFVPDKNLLPVDPRASSHIKCPKCDSPKIKPENSVLDTWFTSALTTDINNDHPANQQLAGQMYPMSMRPQAHDIIRTWALYSIVMAHYRHKQIPWKEIMIAGHILIQGGQKISKKAGGGDYEPEELIVTHSADAIRYAMCNTALGRDTYFEMSQVEKGKKLVTKLYNAVKLALMLFENQSTEKIAKFPVDNLFDTWIIQKSHQAAQEMKKHFAVYEVSLALKSFENFFWSDFCDNYLEIAKARIFSDQTTDTEKNSARRALFEIVLDILITISPFTPHITEELYHARLKDGNIITNPSRSVFNSTILSIHNNKWPEEKKSAYDVEAINLALILISKIRQYKSSHQLNLGTPVGKIFLKTDTEKQKIIQPYINDIAIVTKAGHILLQPDKDAIIIQI